LFRLARSGLLDAAVRFGFSHTSRLLPVRRVCETKYVIAFHHPRRAWARHILFVPKVPIPSLRTIRPEQVPLVRRVVRLALDVAAREQFDRDGFALLVNGGAYQDIGQLHVHLATWPREAQYNCPDSLDGALLLATDVLTAYRHPCPQRSTHIVMLPAGRVSAQPNPDFDDAFIEAAITATQQLVERLELEADGYTLLISAPADQLSLGPHFHLVAGAELTWHQAPVSPLANRERT
jgi:histidine triad (HIT) family protein